MGEGGKYYLYRHIRLDKNVPFYIGIGSKTNKEHTKHTFEYSRAFETRTRSKVWKSIATKTAYEVEILVESNDKSAIELLEIDMIKMYGRIIKNTGTLANLHPGGNYKTGYKRTDEQRKSISDRQTGSKSHKATRIINVINGIVYETLTEASEKLKIDSSCISSMVKGLSENTKSVMLFDDYINKNYRAFDFINKNNKAVINYRTKEQFESIKEAAQSMGIKASKLGEYLNGKKCQNPTDFIKIGDYNQGLTPKTLTKSKKKEKEVYNVVTKEMYSSIRDASNKTGVSYDILYRSLKKETVNKTNLILKSDFDLGLLPQDLKTNKTKKKIVDIVTGEIYDSIREASIAYPINEKQLSKYLCNSDKNKTNLRYKV